MSPQVDRPLDFLQMVDKEKGTVDRRIFSDKEIYEAELEHIFARAWNFMAHESQIPNPGDFFQTYIGEDRVIVVRDKNGAPQVLLNTCRHRGNAVCRAEEGHASSFMCTYHGWTYDLQGKLVGVPGFKDYYHEDLNREEWGLIRAAQVESYMGFIFATLDPDAPGLEDYLGDVGKLGIHHMVARGDNQVVGGIQKWTIGCNWKFAADNVWDYYHGGLTHASAMMAGWLGGTAPRRGGQSMLRLTSFPQFILLGEYGHAQGGPELSALAALMPVKETWRETQEAKDLLGPVGGRAGGHPHIFPNLWMMGQEHQVSLRLPKGPDKTEIWWFTFVDEKWPEEQKQAVVLHALRHNGPAGMFEIEDGENWTQATIGTGGVVSRRYPMSYAMNVGQGEVVEDENGPPYVPTPGLNEHAQLWYYRSWSEWMAARSWSELRKIHSPVPREVV